MDAATVSTAGEGEELQIYKSIEHRNLCAFRFETHDDRNGSDLKTKRRARGANYKIIEDRALNRDRDRILVQCGLSFGYGVNRL